MPTDVPCTSMPLVTIICRILVRIKLGHRAHRQIYRYTDIQIYRYQIYRYRYRNTEIQILRSVAKDPPLTEKPEMLQMSLLRLVFMGLQDADSKQIFSALLRRHSV